MATVLLKGHSIKISGELPKVGEKLKDFTLTNQAFEDVSLSQFRGKKKVISIFPSVDTSVCAASVRKFNLEASGLENCVVINVSADLPPALGRFCAAEGIKNVEVLSSFRSTFAVDYGVRIEEGPLKGLCARSVIVADENDKVIYSQLVPEITEEPNYEKAVLAIRAK